jgi:hypothetical protein
LGLSVSGRVIPEAEKLVPETAIELIVTGTFPVEVSVKGCVDFVLTFTSPKLRLDELALSVAFAAPSCSANVSATPPAVAVNVTVAAVLTEEIVAVKVALDDPGATVTEAGTETSEVLLLVRLTTTPPVAAAAAFSVTVQLSVPVPVIEPVTQLNPVSTGTPVPLRLTTFDVPVDELLVSVNDPDAAPDVAGSNCTVSVAV